MTNLSKQKREGTEVKIELLRGKIDAADMEAQNALLSLEAELKHKKYGLVWEEHEEEIDRILATHLPVLTEQTELTINEGGNTHFLIEGDNLASLEILRRTHKGKIDVIIATTLLKCSKVEIRKMHIYSMICLCNTFLFAIKNCMKTGVFASVSN